MLLRAAWLLVLAAQCLPAPAADMMGFWDHERHGGNCFNQKPPDQAYFDALKRYGASWVRLSADKWPAQQRDFLIGDADAYRGLPPQDLATLVQVLDRADRAGLKVVLTPLSLPGARWAQNNGGHFDDRLWQDRAHWQDAARFWRDLAQALKDHPALAAYNIVNEPAPEKVGGLPEHAGKREAAAWYARQVGGARDLPAFYEQVIAAIREVDTVTPIMVDAGWYAAADGFTYWKSPLRDARVLYSFHMYEPYAVTSAPNQRRKVPLRYPGPAPFGGRSETWNARRVADYLEQPLAWARSLGIPQQRLVAGEFGCLRTMDNCASYLNDVLSTLDRQHLHWAFYSFREDGWDGMDYELGPGKLPWSYWQAQEKGLPPPALPRSATPLFEPIRSRL